VLPFDTGVKLNNSSFSSAVAHGLPVVTTRDDLLEPQFVHGQTVCLCPPQSPDAVAGAIKSLMDDEPLRRRLGEGALRLARDWYSWETALDKTLSIFAQLRAGSTGEDPALNAPGNVLPSRADVG
jgi:glycosyltransferase involved in cell wall biosynthesis